MSENNNLLEVKDLSVHFNNEEGLVKAVDGISFNVKEGETLGVVGESGCGKSVTAMSIMQLIPQPPGIIAGGKIYFKSSEKIIDITALDPESREIRSIRGNHIAMIFQEPMTSLNPVYTIGHQIMEVVRLHQDVGKQKARERAIEMLARVGISAPEQRIDSYPHEFSGGMRQRVMIAMALSCNPDFLIADEPTTALDVTVEAQILKLMKDLKRNLGMSIMIITHDLGVVGDMADRVIVMYMGKVVERASTYDIFYNPRHPYTQGLLKSIPQIGEKKRLTPIRGSVPDLYNLPAGCSFAPRCPEAMDICREQDPSTLKVDEDHHVKCWLYSRREEASLG